jgi:3-hydroxyisobutyrate dehydrogenase-like beta-hydroxyacid dehydrogenase
MDKVSVIGLGLMGSALAKAFLDSGSDVTVWNRTQSKYEQLVKQGARAVPTVTEAIAESPISVICISDYHATNDILGTEDARRVLKGKSVVQLSSGTPQEARESEARIQGCDAEYLDGAILAFPRNIGTPNAMILISGSASCFEKHKSLLENLGNIIFVGESIGLASTQDTAGLTFFIMALLGFMHGTVIFESEDLSVEEYLEFAESAIPVLIGELRQITDRIKSRKYDDTDAELKSWTAGAGHLVQLAQENQITSEVPEFLSRIFNQAIASGHSKHDIAALIEIFRKRSNAI